MCQHNHHTILINKWVSKLCVSICTLYYTNILYCCSSFQGYNIITVYTICICYMHIMQRRCLLLYVKCNFTNLLYVLTVWNVITGSSSRTDTIVVLNELFRYVSMVFKKNNNKKNKKCWYTSLLFAIHNSETQKWKTKQ